MTTPDVARASVLVDAARWDEALRLLGPRVASAPDDTQAWCLIARSYLGLGTIGKAIVAAQSAIASDPNNELPHRLHALGLMRNGDTRLAREAASEAVRLAPNLWATHHLRARIDLQAGYVTRATWDAARRAVELAPDEPGTHELLGLIALREDNHPVAEAQFREVLRLDPTNAAAMNNLAVVQMRRRRVGRAMAQFVGALRLEPNDPLLARNLRGALRIWAAALDVIGIIGCAVLLYLTSGHDVTTGNVVLPSGDSFPTYRHVNVVGHPASLLIVGSLVMTIILVAVLTVVRNLGASAGRIVRAALEEDRTLRVKTASSLVAGVAVLATAAIGLPAGRRLLWAALVLSFLSGLLSGRFRLGPRRRRRTRIQIR